MDEYSTNVYWNVKHNLKEENVTNFEGNVKNI